MFREKNKQYIAWGLTAFCVVAASIVLYFFIHNFDDVRSAVGRVIRILMPFIYGFIMAFLLTPLYDRVYNAVTGGQKMEKSRKRAILGRFLGTCCSIVLIFSVLTMLISMVIPQLITGFMDLYNKMPDSVTNVETLITVLLKDDPEAQALALKYYDQIYTAAISWVNTNVIPNINKYLTSITSGVVKFVSGLSNFLIGVIVMAYVLNMKDRLAVQCKRAVYALLPVSTANGVIDELRYISNVFSRFIIGKLIDSAIVGLICYVCMTILRMPYALVISVIVGVTNIIPFFGPFIGAVPSVMILLMLAPVSAVQFLVLILALQQFDGNILGPRILGSTTGVSSFWVLFSILFFGGIWGVVGMIIGIPTFAVISRQFKKLVEWKLKKKNLPTELASYEDLDRVEGRAGSYQIKTHLHSEEK